ncbi:MAG: Re/Si-specific NAD(P)(+) transhydrogenase subunit alpha [Chloroflexi bacterium]|uniref:proton-translocating NAD(P)(+) transhydrogenase n=1 Tax=Candidatus Chlorohelix allophototropha TaxID=3003348 RepID=A0A8T7LX51_9CHLR|nr:Re/Si-specific NAD(P)(+) transhydrogenase subunit alpha [Chloroflexota bacterium]WJW67416.1 Re/Si-specific NAD(P)(+) transhydrogenase subunit alpha [Chloroflexota bacterium L227-S17]
MKIGIPKEIYLGETRVALVPGLVVVLKKQNHEVFVEKCAGKLAFCSDKEYEAAGAQLVNNAKELYQQVDVIFKVQPPQFHPEFGRYETDMLQEGATLLSFLAPFAKPEIIEALAHRKITAYSMELIPRIARAQNMDALSAMATIAGYKAVLLAAGKLKKMFPLMMTAAGTVSPATVLVLGAGVAGLQAIATAKRLGARVEAFDPRPIVRDQVKSVGANFVEMELPKDAETSGGYAKEQSDEFLMKEREVISARLPKVDVVITTAQVFGKRAPLLISREMVQLLKPGSIIVDLAAEQGGNCELTAPNQTIESNDVTIIGAVNLPAAVPADASLLYSHNLLNLFEYLFPNGKASPSYEDEIVKAACVTRGGEILNEQVKALLPQGVMV